MASEAWKKQPDIKKSTISKFPEGRHDIERALELNKQMQTEALKIKEQLTELLKSVKATYLSNEQLINEDLQSKRKGVGIQGDFLRGRTFYRRGNMFFKDKLSCNCPNNSDYNRRSRDGEMFPMDLGLQGRHIWTLKDKQDVVQGIKEQVCCQIILNY